MVKYCSNIDLFSYINDQLTICIVVVHQNFNTLHFFQPTTKQLTMSKFQSCSLVEKSIDGHKLNVLWFYVQGT